MKFIAQAPPTSSSPIAIPSYGIHSWAQVTHIIINILLLIVCVTAVFGIIIGGYQYITSMGNPDQAKKGRMTLFASIIALVIAGAAFAAVSFVFKYIFS